MGLHRACAWTRGGLVTRSALVVALSAGPVCLAQPEPEPAAEGAPAAPALEPPTYEISRFVIEYADDRDHPDRPSASSLLDTSLTLGVVTEGYVEPREGLASARFELTDLERLGPARFNLAAIELISQALLRRMNEEGIIGVVVVPQGLVTAPNSPNYGADQRDEGDTAMRFSVRTALIGSVRSLAFGSRIPFEERVDNEKHRWIRDGSPVQPHEEGDEGPRRDLLNADRINEYALRLNRHPSRQVDVAVSAGEAPGTAALDYMITENNPLVLYFQVSNTGTEETEEWRERFGLIHSQVTGNDDILSIDFVTGAFDATNALIAGYEAPLPWLDRRLRYRIYGSYGEFTASDVGQASEDFEGTSYSVGGELIYNLAQSDEFFLDVIAGARWENIENENVGFGIKGETSFFLPYAGARLTRQTERSSLSVSGTFEFNLPEVAGTDEDELDALGRLGTDEQWVLFKYDVTGSVFLEPLLNADAWHAARPAAAATLAHELSGSFRGQYSFGTRLIPNAQQVIGGLYSVRGYPESSAVGDDVWVASAEYRYYVARSLVFSEEVGELFGEPFRWRPQQPYGRADWDLVLRGFIDAGRVESNDPVGTETDETLIGAGVGAEFLFKRNLSVRLDLGFALEETADAETDSGDSRLHVAATILF